MQKIFRRNELSTLEIYQNPQQNRLQSRWNFWKGEENYCVFWRTSMFISGRIEERQDLMKISNHAWKLRNFHAKFCEFGRKMKIILKFLRKIRDSVKISMENWLFPKFYSFCTLKLQEFYYTQNPPPSKTDLELFLDTINRKILHTEMHYLYLKTSTLSINLN